MIGSGLKCGTGMLSKPALGGDTLLLLFAFWLRVWLNIIGVKVFTWSELLERDLEEAFFFGLSIAVDLERGLPDFGINSAAIRLAQGMAPNSPENFLSSSAIGEGELDKLPPGESRPLCLSKAFQKGLELLKVRLFPSRVSSVGVSTIGLWAKIGVRNIEPTSSE